MDKRTLIFMACISLTFFGIQFYFRPTPSSAPKPEKPIAATLPAQIAQVNIPVASSHEESYYVLENEYQQLVFSSKGGAIAEINLPIRSEKNPKSLVKEIDIDREILAQSPQNARFPLNGGVTGGYYPLLRRSILNKDGTIRSSVPPEYYALNVVGGDIGNYSVTRQEPNLIQFVGTSGNVKITKTYSFPKERNGPYCFDLDIQVDGDARGLWLSSGVPDVELVGGSYSPTLKYKITQNNGYDVEEIKLPKKGPVQNSALSADWLSNSNGFLGVIIDPKGTELAGYQAAQVEGNKLPTRLSLIDSGYNLYPPSDYPGYITYMPLKSNGAISFRVFAGPYDGSLFKQIDALYDDPSTNYNPEYTAAQTIQGWFSFISRPFTKFLAFLMEMFYGITHSWAVSIVLLTIALRAMMYPLNSWSIRSQVKMAEAAPKIKAIQEKYKKDPKRAQMEVMNFYKESGANPLMGCLPALLQMPFLIGMFYLLKSSFPLRGAVFIPGWIDDLAAPDVLFSWNQPIWFFGTDFHLLPILMGLTMYLQSKMTSKVPKDEPLSDAQKQQKMMGIMMPVLFTVLFYNFPSGLNIYFMFSTLLGIAQQAWLMKGMKKPVTS